MCIGTIAIFILLQILNFQDASKIDILLVSLHYFLHDDTLKQKACFQFKYKGDR